MLWDQRGNTSNDYAVWKLFRENGIKDVPLVEEMHQFSKPEDQFQFTVMSKAKGVTLESAWPGLSQKEKQGYAQQVTAALRAMRQFTAPFPQRVGGGALYDGILTQCDKGNNCKKIERTKEEWLNNMAAELRDGLDRRMDEPDEAAVEAQLQQLKDNFPDGAPYVLTHCDLSFSNIIINNGKIEAIIDWEHAGYYPWWVERWSSQERGNMRNAGEFWDLVWAELDPELDRIQFHDQISKHVNAVESVWPNAEISHTQDHDIWLRPAFCNCRPFGGLIQRRFWGAEMKHEIGWKKGKNWLRKGYNIPG
ncbi:kinase-like domain-containing protein [Massariosphaeria phaeospora]|uniref:Kinase-like domain-containing protein n=1 Tax=Massariosphaeria phaeospora TaxID=100035 RepID=A0A7C8MIY6_9PLEO|nr:kinase-like domain-containing protein [Massariosphaeria phaeospora]